MVGASMPAAMSISDSAVSQPGCRTPVAGGDPPLAESRLTFADILHTLCRIPKKSQPVPHTERTMLETATKPATPKIASGGEIDAQSQETDGFQLVIDALKLNGIDTIFGLPGIPITDLTRRLQAAGLRVISFHVSPPSVDLNNPLPGPPLDIVYSVR